MAGQSHRAPDDVVKSACGLDGGCTAVRHVRRPPCLWRPSKRTCAQRHPSTSTTAIIVDCGVVGISPEILRFTGPILRTSPVVISPTHQTHRLVLHFCSPQLASRHPIGKRGTRICLTGSRCSRGGGFLMQPQAGPSGVTTHSQP